LCIKDGKIVESGTHDELIAPAQRGEGGVYWAMWQKQIRAQRSHRRKTKEVARRPDTDEDANSNNSNTETTGGASNSRSSVELYSMPSTPVAAQSGESSEIASEWSRSSTADSQTHLDEHLQDSRSSSP